MTKPKVTLLNLFVGATCFVVAGSTSLDLLGFLAFLLVGYLTVGGCGALNCFYDRDLDRLMTRTSKRALPSGRVQPSAALIFALASILSGLMITYFWFGLLTLAFVMSGMLFYLVIYTLWLKRTSRWSVVIGAAAGSFAAFSGWTATGSTVALTPILVGLLDFLWTPGHLWGLAMKRVDEYAAARVPMLPNVSGFRNASRLIAVFNILTVGVSIAPWAIGITGSIYLLVAIVAGSGLLVTSLRLLKLPSRKNGLRLFLFSIPYLASLMIALIADKWIFLVT